MRGWTAKEIIKAGARMGAPAAAFYLFKYCVIEGAPAALAWIDYYYYPGWLNILDIVVTLISALISEALLAFARCSTLKKLLALAVLLWCVYVTSWSAIGLVLAATQSGILGLATLVTFALIGIILGRMACKHVNGTQ